MELRKKALIGAIVAIVGFAAAAGALWDRFLPPTPDNEVFIVPKDTPDISVSSASPVIDTNYVKVNELIIDGVGLEVTEGGLLLANKIIMKNGGEIFGTNLYIVSTIIDNGKINSSNSIGIDGGNIFIASAQINSTEIISNGKNGITGVNGNNGTRGSTGVDGRNGNCKGFGA